MFLLARSWGFGPWGRWFAGLTFPFCGFLVVWLMFPVTSVAIWMPWIFWATERVMSQPSARRIATLSPIVGFTVLGGHIQTSAHVLLAVGAYSAWRVLMRWRRPNDSLLLESLGKSSPTVTRSITGWTFGLILGLILASVTILPLAVYLGKSPVWEDRRVESASPLSLTRPRVLDAICTAIPYAFGSQIRSHPNLARALGVHNLNESAGGFCGLATLVWLAPLAWTARRRQPKTVFLVGLVAVGFLGAFGFAPVANLLRAIPVLSVMDQRRLTLWVAFGMVLLGGIGLDQLWLVSNGRSIFKSFRCLNETQKEDFSRPWPGLRLARYWVSLWVAASVGLIVGALCLPWAEPSLRKHAHEHYAKAAMRTEGADPEVYRSRADRQVKATIRFLPRILTFTGLELGALSVLAVFGGPGRTTRGILLGLTLAELAAFGMGLNPAITRDKDRPETPVVARVRELAGKTGRVLGIGQEWPPNVAMRYGLCDIRNYDSVELTRNLDWLAPLYEKATARTSRRTITWNGVTRSLDQIRESGVAAIVAASPPPAELASRAERIGDAWVVALDGLPKYEAGSEVGAMSVVDDNGRIHINITLSCENILIIRETFDSGWRATVDGSPARLEPYRGVFLAARVGKGSHRVDLVYDPPEVRAAVGLSLGAAALIAVLGAGFDPRRAARFLAKGLGRFGAFGLESNSRSSPDNLTG
jgi:hypothetical protein